MAQGQEVTEDGEVEKMIAIIKENLLLMELNLEVFNLLNSKLILLITFYRYINTFHIFLCIKFYLHINNHYKHKFQLLKTRATYYHHLI